MKKTQSGGDALINGLVNYGADTVFCVPGESYLDALNALYDQESTIRVITCRQEGGAAYMADAYGKLTGKPGICFVSRGPGASNAMVGIHTAFQDSTPVLMFVGQVARRDFGREAFQELDFIKVYGDVAKKVIRINDAVRIPEQLSQAWHTATSGRPGPVVVELPEDMLTEQVESRDFIPVEIFRPGPDAKAITRLSEMLASAHKPVILAGGAGWTPKATEYLLRFSEQQQIPVATVFRRTDSFDNTHTHYIGELGTGVNPDLVEFVQSADLLLAIGPRLGEMTTSGYTIFEPPDSCRPGQKLVHVHISDEEINSVYRSDLGIVSQPELFLQAASSLPPNNIDRSGFINQGNGIYTEFLNQPRNPDSAVRMDLVSKFLRKTLKEDAVITNGAGNYTAWALRNYQFRQPRTQAAPTNGSMGYGVPAAIAAKLVFPQSTVVSFSGDGCFLMNGQELATAVQYNLDIIFLVINNGCYGTIRTHQENHYPGRPIATDLNNPDFAALARAYGAAGFTVVNTEEFENAFVEAMSAGKPALIEIQTDY